MGTTLAALQAGSGAFVFVVRITGYGNVLTSANATQISNLLASEGSDWGSSSYITGITVELDNQQVINPWEPFNGAGKCTIKVPDTTADTFGIDTHRMSAGVESTLKSTIGRSDTAIPVKLSTNFTSGTVYCGTESIAWSAKPDSATLTASKRGQYSQVYGSTRFAGYHRCVTSSLGARLEPVVSEQPRNWIGRQVGVWLHRMIDSATLDPLSQAQLVFAGQIAEVRDDPTFLGTVVLVEHELDRIAKAQVAAEPWTATVKNGHHLAAGWELAFDDWNGTTQKVANTLQVVASGASGTNQINEGDYSLEEICSAINAWLGGEYAAGRISGTYTLSSPEDVNGQQRSVMHYNIAGSGTVSWALRFWTATTSFPIADVLGINSNQIWDDSGTAGAAHGTPGDKAPAEAKPFTLDNGFSFKTSVENATGTFVDQYASLPAGAKQYIAHTDVALGWGLFLLTTQKGSFLLLGTLSGSTLKRIYSVPSPIVPSLAGFDDLFNFTLQPGDPPPTIKQIFVHEAPLKTLLKWFFYSSGTAGYSNATYDVLGIGQGLGVHPDLLGSAFENACDLLPGADITEMVVIDKPTAFKDLFAADLVLRRSHLIWRNGHLQFVNWSTPSSQVALTALGEGTKAAPAGNQNDFRAPTTLDATWLHNVVKLNYNRDITQAASGGGGKEVYRNTLSLVDAPSVDDQGGNANGFTLDCRNIYSDGTDTGPALQQLISQFLAWFTWFSRPLRKLTRSIDQRYYEGFGVADMAAATDPYARDPSTGRRGVTARPGLVVRHRYNFGGAQAGDPTQKTPQAGEVDIVFLDVNRVSIYAPCAEVDDTQSNAGYNAGTFTLTCYANKHSEASETADAGNFTANDKAIVVEVDPSDSANPLLWHVTIASVSGNQIMLTAGLTSPAWDATKRYRIISDVYTTAQTSQQAKVYQAGTDGTVQQTVPAFQYGEMTATTLATALDHTELPELMPDVAWSGNTGAPRDTGHEEALINLIENLIDHGCSRQSPSLLDTPLTNTVYTTGYRTLVIRPIFIGGATLGGSINRQIAVAPFFRSADGSTVSVRISLSGHAPNDSTLNDMTIKAPSQANTWSTQSTTWATGQEQILFLQNYNGLQYAWLIVEATYQGSVYGVAEYVVRERFLT